MDSNTGIKSKSDSNTLPLIVMGVFIVLLIGIGVFFFISKARNQNIYLTAIDQMGEYFISNIKEQKENMQGANSLKGKVNFKLTSTDATIKNIAMVLNKIELAYQIDMDYNNKLNSTSYNLNYKDDVALNVNTYIKDKNSYVYSDGIYERYILLSDLNMGGIWQISANDDYASFIREIAKTFKSTLKKEYFTKENNGNETNYKLHISKDELNVLKNNFLNAVKKNQIICNGLINIVGLKEKDLNDLIDKYLGTNLNSNYDLDIETYLNNRNEVEKINFKYNNTLSLVKEKSNEYNILVDNTSYGKLKIATNGIIIDLLANDDELRIEILKDKFSMDAKIQGTKVLVSLNKQSNNYNGTINFINEEAKVNLLITNKATLEEIKEVVLPGNLFNAIDYKNITDFDMNRIMGNIENNEGFKNIIQDFLITGLDILSLTNENPSN